MIALALRALLCAITIPIVAYSPAPGGSAMVDTGGMTESRAHHPLDFASLYRGLDVDYVLGVDYLALHPVSAGDTAGTPKHTVKLEVRVAKPWTLAFVECTIGRLLYRMLLDTAALVWPSQATSKPSGALYLSTAAFQALRRAHADWPYRPGGLWIVDARGHFVQAASLIGTTDCGGVTRPNRLIVERADDSTYRYMRRLFALEVDGDVSLAAFEAPGVDIDFPARALYIF